MIDVMSTTLAWALLASWLSAPVAVAQQVELDRIVSRVGDRIVTQSDVRQVRLLHLVEETSSDEAALRALESRLLVLHELARAAPVGPISPEALAARRAEWADEVGGAAGVPALLRRAGVAEADLDRWLRDDLRIQAYLRRQFGMLGADERERATAEWLGRLRERADLP